VIASRIHADVLTAKYTKHAKGWERKYCQLRHLTCRRAPSCPRAVRQTLSKWPRLFENESFNEPIQLTVV
jgi:hypothetical protein